MLYYLQPTFLSAFLFTVHIILEIKLHEERTKGGIQEENKYALRSLLAQQRIQLQVNVRWIQICVGSIHFQNTFIYTISSDPNAFIAKHLYIFSFKYTYNIWDLKSIFPFILHPLYHPYLVIFFSFEYFFSSLIRASVPMEFQHRLEISRFFLQQFSPAPSRSIRQYSNSQAYFSGEQSQQLLPKHYQFSQLLMKVICSSNLLALYVGTPYTLIGYTLWGK